MARHQDRILPAIGLRLISALLFATMNGLIKLVEARGVGLWEILFFRQFGAACVMLAIVAAGPGFAAVRTRRLAAHLGRTTLGLSAMACTFVTIMLLPLAESTTLGFSMPIFATIFGALVLREPTGWHRWAAVAIGFVGVLIVVQPGSGHIPAAGVATGLLAALLTAGVSILLRRISQTEGVVKVVFWFSVLSLPPLGIGYALSFQPRDPASFALLLTLGMVGGAAQLAMTSAIRFAPVSVVVPMDYSSLVWATLFGWLLFDTLPGEWTWVGAPVIIASGLYIVWRERLRHQQETLQATV